MRDTNLTYHRVQAALRQVNNPDLRDFLKVGLEKAMDEGDTSQMRHALNLHTYPVHIEDFIFGDRYLGRPKDEMYPAVIEELVNINENHGRLVNTLTEAVLTGGIGCVDGLTEFLTPNGWKRIDQWDGEHVAQIDLAINCKMTFTPAEYVAHPCHRMTAYHSDHVNMVLSPEHRVVLDSGEYRVVRSQALLEDDSERRGIIPFSFRVNAPETLSARQVEDLLQALVVGCATLPCNPYLLSQRQLQLIAKVLYVQWGHCWPCSTQEVAGFFQYLLAATGHFSLLAELDEGYEVRLQRPDTRIAETRQYDVSPINSMKYCFTVPTGVWLARRNGRVFITGNSAKTTTALYTNAYQLYLMSCYKSPHTMFNLDSTSEILFIFQSMNATLSKELDFERFKSICQQSYYFTTVFPFDKTLKSTLKFPNKIEAKPVTSDGGAIGQNVVSGLIDEVNFMAIIERSKKATGGGTYDQAKAIYDSVSRRIKTRFLNNGGMPGMLCLVSSKHYPGEFTDLKLEEAKTDPTIYVYDKRVWEVKPSGTYSGEWFYIFTGDETRKPKILEETDPVHDDDRHLVLRVPMEYRRSFERDMIGALRDIAGVGTLARYPYIFNSDALMACFGKVPSLLSLEEHDFRDESTGFTAYPSRITNPDCPRWVHIDLSISGDSTGVACGHVTGFTKTESGDMLPNIQLDFILRVNPPPGGEIIYSKIRSLLYKLRELGLPIRWVSFDGFQSVDNTQILRSKGFTTGYISMDTSLQPYEMTKTAFYDGRVSAPTHRVCQKEFLSLEKLANKQKVDHPPSGSKDCSDAVAGVVYGLTLRREIWAQYGIPLLSIPDSVRTLQQKEK